MIKKIIVAALLTATIATTNAQSLLPKVPNNASVVVKYAAENFTKNTTLQKLDSYSFVKKDFFKMLHMDSLTSLKNLGINFEKDVYQYLTMQDTSLTFVTLFNLSNAEQFFKVIKANYNSTGKLEKKNGFSFYSADASTYFGWTNDVAIMVNTSYQNKKNYYDYQYSYSDTVVAATAAVEVAPMVENNEKMEELKAAIEDASSEPAQKKKGNTKGKKPVIKSNTAKIQALKKAKRLKEERERFVADSIETVKRDLWYQQQDMIAKKYQYGIAEKIMNTAFNGTIKSIENEINYTKIIEPTAHVSVWINNETLMSQYNNFFALGRYYGMGSYYGSPRVSSYQKDTSANFNSAVNIYFEKDKIRMEQKTFSTDAELTRLGNAVMDSKQNASILNYVNSDNIGYLSMSVNTEAMANYYYTVIKKYLNNNSYMNEYGEAVNLYVDLLQILIDEKGIADLTPGNYLFVLHDMKNRLVSYTDYEFDKEYNKKEIKKTKNELTPNFTYVMETRKDAFMQRVMNLPLKYAKKEKWNYSAKNGYNELVFKEGELPISSLYFMVKDGKGIITTSKEVIDNTLAGKGFTIDEETKNNIMNHNYSLKINTKKVLEKLGPELSTNASKKVNDYFLQNFGDVKMESNVKDGIIQSTTTINIKGEHTNSFEFLFDMMDAINNIMEKEKQEDEKKIN
jgi:hypothetical protein